MSPDKRRRPGSSADELGEIEPFRPFRPFYEDDGIFSTKSSASSPPGLDAGDGHRGRHDAHRMDSRASGRAGSTSRPRGAGSLHAARRHETLFEFMVNRLAGRGSRRRGVGRRAHAGGGRGRPAARQSIRRDGGSAVREGNEAPAIRLEELWKQPSKNHSSPSSARTGRRLLQKGPWGLDPEDLCRALTGLSRRKLHGPGEPDERLRNIAELQQRRTRCEGESAERRTREVSLPVRRAV